MMNIAENLCKCGNIIRFYIWNWQFCVAKVKCSKNLRKSSANLVYKIIDVELWNHAILKGSHLGYVVNNDITFWNGVK